MTVEQLRTAPVRRSRAHAPARPALQGAVGPAAEDGPLCLVIPEIADGEAGTLVRSLRRRESTHAVLLTRRAARRDIVVLLGAGVRGAVTAEPAGAAATTGGQARPGVPALTAREVGVLRLVAEGRSNREIGEELALSALTVKSHLARISRKIGTGDRAEMVAFAIRHDLLR